MKSILLLSAFIPSVVLAQSIFTPYSAFQNWLPVIMAAITASASLVSMYYLLGAVLGNKRIKANAITEFGQIIGLTVIVVILVGILYTFGTSSLSTFYSIPPSSLANICNTYLVPSSINNFKGSPLDILSGYPTNTICNIEIPNAQAAAASPNPHIATNIDYGLSAAYILNANITNQTAANLNSLYIFENYMAFLRELDARVGICEPIVPTSCIIPREGFAFESVYTYEPFVGYYMMLRGTKMIEAQAYLLFYLSSFILLFIILFIYIWPYLLAGGIILHSSFLTRKVGGLLMAISIVMVIIYPIFFIFEYTSLTSPSIKPVGASLIPSMSLYYKPFNDNTCIIGDPKTCPHYTPNFFVIPNLAEAINYNGCWPSGLPGSTGLLSAELKLVAYYTFPLSGAVTGGGAVLAVISSFGSSHLGGISPAMPPYGYFNCHPTEALNSLLAILHVYGIDSVIGFILPILNLLIIITSIMGLSSLFGGNTSLLGLSRLL